MKEDKDDISTWFKEQQDLDDKVDAGEISEEEVVEIILKKNLELIEKILDRFEAADPDQRKIMEQIPLFNFGDEAQRKEMRITLAEQKAKAEGLAARLLARKGRNGH